MAMTTVTRLPRHSATSAMAIRIAGIAMMPSMKRISTPSSQRR
jgi:hypothetical protein